MRVHQPSLLARLIRGRYRRKAQFTGKLTHEVVVPPARDGRPGERLLAPSRSLHAPNVSRFGYRKDFQVIVDSDASPLTALCLGTTAQHGDPEQAARETLQLFREKGLAPSRGVAPDEIAGERAYRYEAHLSVGRLTEWKFAHDGWLYVVGVVALGMDHTETVHQVRRVLGTWQWVPAPTAAT